MKQRKHLIPDVVSGPTLVKLKPTNTVRDAAVLMDSNKVSSVLIMDDHDKLCGIFTVRDVARRVVGGHLDPDKTPLSKVMTERPQCVGVSETPYSALRQMQDGRYRHLPVTDDGTPDGQVVGIVSRRIFFPEEEALLKMEEHLREVMW